MSTTRSHKQNHETYYVVSFGPAAEALGAELEALYRMTAFAGVIQVCQQATNLGQAMLALHEVVDSTD